LEKERKLQIIKAAVKRFDKHGLNKTTLDEIARDLRIGKATIYHYFKSKEDLYFAALDWEGSLFLEEIKAILNHEQLTFKECLFEYFLFKELISQKYKLIFDTIIQIVSENNFDKEISFFKNLLNKEEELIKDALSKKFSVKDVSTSQISPSYLVLQSWGLFLGNKINSVIGFGKESSPRELVAQLLNNI
jgi:AcrR family transcriptional regulator